MKVEKTVSSDSDPAIKYTVTVHPSGAVSCTCPSAHHRPGQLCKHGRHVLEQLQQPDGPACPDCGGTLQHETADRWQCSVCGSRATVGDDGEARPWPVDPFAFTGRGRK